MSGRQYRPRIADAHLTELMAEFPAVMITGPRAAGKTTTATRHVNQVDRLDVPGVAATYRADPDAALRRGARPILIDEWQQVPEVLAAVKRTVDRNPTPGQILLTGSVRAEMTNETWAGTGRVVRTEILGLTERECHRDIDAESSRFLTQLATGEIGGTRLPVEPLVIDDYITRAVRGGFPEVVFGHRSERAAGLWLASYLRDLVTRDAMALGGEKDPAKLRRYLEVLALNNAGMPTDATLYGAADVNARTAAGYDQLLQNLYILTKVPAWSTNRLSRLVKAPKRYLVDTGLTAAAANLAATDIVTDTDLTGRFLDAFVLAQIRPEIALMYPRPRVYHLRAEGGRHEIDLVIELSARRIVGLEIKATAAPTARDARHLFWLRDQLGSSFRAGAVLHTGPGVFELGDRVSAIPISAMWS